MRAAILVGALLTSWNPVASQTASPAASPHDVACDVAPRTDTDLTHLAQSAATPAGDAGEGTPDGTLLEDGVVADDQTRAAIESALALVDVCAESGDVARLLSLYTDGFIVREVLAAEPVPIVPGTPDTSSSTGTPETAGTGMIVHEVRILSDGRVAAQVQRDGRNEVVVFVEVDGRWLVDAIATETGAGGTPEAGVPDDLASLPPVQAAVSDAARTAGVPEDVVVVTSVEPTVWSDSSLGCPQPDQFYAQAETAGYAVILNVSGTEVIYHTDEGDAVVPCEAGN